MTDQPTRKELTHERIVRTAARAIRRKGCGGVGVADIMKEAGLTHGGFYAHFPSKDALLAEATDQAGSDSVGRLTRLAASVPPEEALGAIIDAYLSDHHALAVESGCPVVALGSEMPRQAPQVRRAATERIKEMIDLLARQMPGWGQPGQRDKAMALYSCLVGALLVSRAVDDPELAAAMRMSARRFLQDFTG